MSAPFRQASQSSVAITFLPRSAESLAAKASRLSGRVGMHADLVEIEQMIEQPHIPIGGAAGADMPQHLRALAREMLGAQRGHGAGAHVGDGGRIQDRLRHAGRWIEQVEDRHLGGQAELEVVDEVADDLDAGEAQRLHHAAQHVEMPVGGALGNRDGRAARSRSGPIALRAQAGSSTALRISSSLRAERVDIRAIEIGDEDLLCRGSREFTL